MIRCDTCEGKGTVTCAECAGKGDLLGTGTICKHCEGLGIVRCGTCDGKGLISAETKVALASNPTETVAALS